MSLAERLYRFGLLGLAGDDVAALEVAGPVRSAFIGRVVASGWALANVVRVLGEPRTEASGGAPPLGHRAQRGERERSASGLAPAAHAPAPRPVAAGSAGDGAPPREPPRPRLLGPVRSSDPTPEPPPAPRSAPRRRAVVDVDALPAAERPRMVPGPGQRFECVHESGCLGRAIQAARSKRADRRGEGESLRAVHCPPSCAFKTSPSFERRHSETCFSRGQGSP